MATVGVEDPAPEDTLAVAGVEGPASEDALALKKKLRKMKDEQEEEVADVATEDKMELIQKTAESKDQPPLQL